MKQIDTKAVLIDFDGTLLDSLPSLYKTYFEFMQEHGLEGTSDEFRAFNGHSLRDVVALLRDRYQMEESFEQLRHHYEALLKKFYHVELKLFPGVKEFLSFTEMHHLPLVIVSSGSADFIRLILEREKISHYFQEIVTPEEGKFRGKPSPDLYLKALSSLSIQSEEAVVIEDAPLGIEAALAAGIHHTLHIIHGEKIKGHRGVISVTNWFEILDLFKNKFILNFANEK